MINTNFETWRPMRADFDSAVAFTSFHWIAPETRYAKTASLLREHGTLAVVSTRHVLPDDGDDFFVQYRRTTGGRPGRSEDEGGNRRPASSRRCTRLRRGDRRQHLLSERRRAAYFWDVTYSADAYLAVLNTYSGHRALDDDTRRRLLSRIRRRIDARQSRRVRKTYLAMLNVAQRL